MINGPDLEGPRTETGDPRTKVTDSVGRKKNFPSDTNGETQKESDERRMSSKSPRFRGKGKHDRNKESRVRMSQRRLY